MPYKELNKIMVVEDEIDIQTVIKYALENVGKLKVKYCYSGEEALQQAETFSPDMILLDVMMPKMDGISTLQEIRKIPSLKNTPVIFMTAKAQANEVSYYNELNILDVILKPFDAMTLSESLHTSWRKYHEKQQN